MSKTTTTNDDLKVTKNVGKEYLYTKECFKMKERNHKSEEKITVILATSTWKAINHIIANLTSIHAWIKVKKFQSYLLNWPFLKWYSTLIFPKWYTICQGISFKIDHWQRVLVSFGGLRSGFWNSWIFVQEFTKASLGISQELILFKQNLQKFKTWKTEGLKQNQI